MSALQLPALDVQAKAELLVNNLPAFEASFREGVDQLRYELITDDDFAKAKLDIKALKEAETTIKAVDEAIVNGSISVKEIREKLATLAGEAREFRLAREKEVRTRDAARNLEIIEEAMALIDHPKLEKFRSQVIESTKRKKSFETKAEAANAVAEGINESILKTRAMLDKFAEDNSTMLIPDRVDLELQDSEGVERELAHRLEKKKDEDEKARLKAEADKLKAEAEAKEKAEAPEPTRPDPPAEMPPPPKVDSIAVGAKKKEPPKEAEESEAQKEWENYLVTLKCSFSPSRDARLALKHPENQQLAAQFSQDMEAAWSKMVNGKGKLK